MENIPLLYRGDSCKSLKEKDLFVNPQAIALNSCLELKFIIFNENEKRFLGWNTVIKYKMLGYANG
tara:strand:+ start:440 stop:637 length:198 start_codon:yes stop_codon:yes gene_type:complete